MDDQPASFTIKGESGVSIRVECSGYEYPSITRGDDANWLNAYVRFESPSCQARTDLYLITGDCAVFAKSLRNVLDRRSGVAEFTTLEDQVSISVEVEGTGRARITGRLNTSMGTDNRVFFDFETDQTFLNTTLRELDAWSRAFPKR